MRNNHESSKLFLALYVCLLFFVVGCSSEYEQIIKVLKRISEENKYEDFREITNNQEVQKIKQILEKADWKTAKVSMTRPSDYQFIFNSKNPNVEAKKILYELWISPDNDTVEVVMGDSHYVQLDKENSSVFLKILIGETLSE